MLEITEIRGTIFSVALSDDTTLTLQAGESQKIKDSLVSDSLLAAVAMRCVSMKETDKKTSNNKKNGGAVTNE